MIVTDNKIFLCRADLPVSKRHKLFDDLTVWDFRTSKLTVGHINRAKEIEFNDGGAKKIFKVRL